MVLAFVDYFENLFTSSNPPYQDSVLQLMDRRLSDLMIADLDCEFTSQEVKRAVDQMQIGKSS